MIDTTVELLAPAGNMACLHAAILAGADGIYLGTEQFNARRNADNFTLESLEEACDFAHLRGCRIYLTVNIAILDDELPAALELIRQAYRRGVDAFIIQDAGVMTRIAEDLPQAELHASTQMNIHSRAGMAAAYDMGARRVTLARELSVQEIAELCDTAHAYEMEVEVFAHGALCVCYSGQCLLSSLIGGRSANRGNCAQPCRLPYALHNRALHKDLDAPGEHLLSPKDLCTIDLLPELVAAGVDSFKIEGRMKSPEYVQAVVRVYRAVLDRVIAWRKQSSEDASDDVNARLAVAEQAPESVHATTHEKDRLDEAFSRGFTTAYLTGDTSGEMMSYGRPNNRGVFVGRVADVRDAVVTIALERPLNDGDVIEFWTRRGHSSHTVHGMTKGRKNEIRMAIACRVGKGDRVFRVRNSSEAFVDDDYAPLVPIHAQVSIKLGRPVSLTLSTDAGISATVTGDTVEAARTKALERDDVAEHIGRLGGTPFKLDSCDVDLDQGVGMGFSRLHALRSSAADALKEQMLSSWHTRTLPRTNHDRTHDREPKPLKHSDMKRSCLVAAWATNPACARAARKAGADVIYVPWLNYGRGQAQVAGQRSSTVEQAGYPKQVVMALPTIDHDLVDGAREYTKSCDPWSDVRSGKDVLVDGWGDIRRAAEEGNPFEVGSHIPAFNHATLDTLAKQGAQRVWLSPELTLGQIQGLGEHASVPLGITLIGYQELMITEHCLLMSQGPCDQNCDSCPRRLSPHYLQDRKDYQMSVITDRCGRSHLFNAVRFDCAHIVPDLIMSGVTSFMVDTTLMNVAESSEAVGRAVHARDTAVRTGNALSKIKGTTTGHLFRSVS
ncbi:MAG: U32 family peptidase [Eggerthellaceae bacterium]|jgi:putative protease|nr:U32 family peptidase [Eggerthellaceae bacterium]